MQLERMSHGLRRKWRDYKSISKRYISLHRIDYKSILKRYIGFCIEDVDIPIEESSEEIVDSGSKDEGGDVPPPKNP